MDEVICNISLLMKYWSIIFLEVHHRIPAGARGSVRQKVILVYGGVWPRQLGPGIQIPAGGGTAAAARACIHLNRRAVGGGGS